MMTTMTVSADLLPTITRHDIDWMDEESVVYMSDQIILVIDFNGAVWRSSDSGTTFINANLSVPIKSFGAIKNQIILDGMNQNMVMFRAESGKNSYFFISYDEGETFIQSNISKIFDQIVVNPSKSGYLVTKSNNEAYYSPNFGRTWTPIFETYSITNVIIWDPMINPSPDTGLYAMAPMPMAGETTVTLIYSPDLGKTIVKLIPNVQDLQATTNYLYVKAFDTKTSGATLYVRNNIEPYNNNLKGLLKCNFELPANQIPKDYDLINDETGSIWVGIQWKTTQSFGDVYTSDSSGSQYTPSLLHVNKFNGIYDFDTFDGIPGTYVANQVVNFNAGEGKPLQLVSMISYDNGGRWVKFNPPAGGSCKGCSLNFNGNSVDQVHPFYTNDNVFGLAVATGYIDNNLNTKNPLARTTTWFSRDTGVNWTSIYEGPSVYEFGNYGNVLLLANATANTLKFSLDQGASFATVQFTTDDPTDVDDILTDPYSSTLKFLVLTPHVIYGVDFGPLGLRQCGDDDHELFTTRPIMGGQITETRMVKGAKCYQADNLPGAVVSQLPCVDDDFECDVGYTEVSTDDQPLLCAISQSYTPPTYPPEYCPPNTKYPIINGYRKITGDQCTGGVESSYIQEFRDCPGSDNNQSKGWIAAVVILVLLAVVVASGAFYLWKHPETRVKLLKKIGITNEQKYSTLGYKPNSLADDEFGIEDDDAQILDDNDLNDHF
ncbi:hypothetical protein SAMD00019534_001100 [Acytostelium subglobosum LB1]|uniref:hypothetical protein n=1 Tax=Acytostelium subglobosum LB1 TaxID=1410327 RepID=UPI000644DF4D|nr:hypothetical protein SAMD00019534_001100 [Acytostelium subglobosum LB1]GAM16935.1 hypothetical protein SAMD00019534_001100 [Acytostelium subglobosum LB1]|eukprot:XP_012758997.1 hypothetical protein SAMD00019534_001100 [Acytostelium subglobosum LB1]